MAKCHHCTSIAANYTVPKDSECTCTTSLPRFGYGCRDVPMKQAGERPETGPMQFGDDSPGMFIRGDEASIFAKKLKGVLAERQTALLHDPIAGDPSRTSDLEGLIATLDKAATSDVRVLKPWRECINPEGRFEPSLEGLIELIRWWGPVSFREAEKWLGSDPKGAFSCPRYRHRKARIAVEQGLDQGIFRTNNHLKLVLVTDPAGRTSSGQARLIDKQGE